MQPFLWIWLLGAPALAVLIDQATSPRTTSFGRHERDDQARNDARVARGVPAP